MGFEEAQRVCLRHDACRPGLDCLFPFGKTLAFRLCMALHGFAVLQPPSEDQEGRTTTNVSQASRELWIDMS